MKRRSPPARRPARRPDSTGRRLWAGWLAVAVLLVSVSSPANANESEAFIRDTAKRVFTSFSDETLDSKRSEVFREILTDTFALKTISRFTLGRYWRVASSDQRKEYRRLFEDFLVLAYANRFGDLGGTKLRIVSVRTINKRNELVRSEAVNSDGRPPIRLEWRVRHTKRGLRIVDVIVNGISMSVTQRDQFAAVISSAGGKVEGLLAMLRSKTAPPE